jgi:HlyD family secretion protein
MIKLSNLRSRLWPWARRRPFHAGGAALLLILALVFTVRAFVKTSAPQNNYFTTKKGSFLISIIEGGTLKAVHESTVRAELEGSTRILSIVPEGTSVKKGDLLVELDSADLRDRVTAQDVTFQNSRFAYLQSKETLAIQKSMTESNIKDAELKVEFAVSDLEKYKEGDWPQLRKNTETRITIAQEELERAKDRLNWTQVLEKKGYATKTELEADVLALKRKEIECAQTQEELRLMLKYDYPKRVRLLEANVDSTEAELGRVKQRSAANLASYEADLNTRKGTLDLHEARLAQLKEQLSLTKIYAPQDGLVVYASSSNPGSGILVEEGAMVRQKQDLIKLPDVSQMMVEIRVHESHVQKIRPGLSAYVTIDSLPERQFKASVRRVAVLPDSNSRYYNPNLKVYVTEVVIEEQIPDLKPGISGRAEIVITNLMDVITVPIQAVTSVKGRQVCFVDKGVAQPAPTEVEVGMYNDKYIEIRKGLEIGDRVLLSPLGNSDSIDLSGSFVDAEEAESATKAAMKRSADLAAENARQDRERKKGGTESVSRQGVEPRRINPYLADPAGTSKPPLTGKPRKRSSE